MARNEKQYQEYKELRKKYAERFDMPIEADPFAMAFGYSQGDTFEEEIRYLKMALKEGKEVQEFKGWEEFFYEGIIR